MKTVYFVLGMHRSGTSALTGVLSNTGMDVGTDLMPSTGENTNGYFENYKVFWFNEKILKEYNSAWDDCQFDVNDIKNNDLMAYVSEAKEIIKSEYKFSENILIKDPRNCLLFPIWEQACNELKYNVKVIIPYRSPLEVAESIKVRDKIPYEQSIIMWVHHFLSAEYFSRNHERMFMFFDDLIEDSENSITKIEEFTKNKISKNTKAKIFEFLNPKYKNNNIPIKNFSKQIPEFLQLLMAVLENHEFDDIKKLDQIRKEFYHCLYLFHHEDIIKSLILLKKLTVVTEEQQSEIELITKRQQLSDTHITNIEGHKAQLENSLDNNADSLEQEQNSNKLLKEQQQEQINEFNLLKSKLAHEEEISLSIGQDLKQQEDRNSELNKLRTQLANEQEKQKLSKNHIKNLGHSIIQFENNINDITTSLEREQIFKQELKKHFEKQKLTNEEIFTNEKKILENNIKQIEVQNNKLESQKIKLKAKAFNKISKLEEKINYLEQSLNDKTGQINAINENLSQQTKDLNKIHESKILEMTKLHLNENKNIELQLVKIKADAVHAVNIYSKSWHEKTDHDTSLSLRAINNLQLFYNINNQYIEEKNKSRAQLISKLSDINTGLKTATHPYKVLNIIDQIKNIEADIINIDKRINRIPWSFIQEYDEALYLEMNNDVAKEVVKGKFTSGLEHFIFFGFDEVKLKGRRISLHIPAYTAPTNSKSVEHNDCNFLNYLEKCYKNRIVYVHNPAIAALQALDHVSKLSSKDQFNNLLTIEKSNAPLDLSVVKDVSNLEHNSDDIQIVYDYIEPQINETIKTKIENFENKPLISIIMPVYNVDPKWLDLAIQSINKQWYSNWEICIVDDKSNNKPTLDYLKAIKNDKIKIHYSKTNVNISVTSNTALLMTRGKYVALMDNDDELTPDALYEVVNCINKYGAEFIYSDEDKLEMDGSYSDPHFKPDFSPDLFLSQNYMSHLGVMKKDLMIKSNGFTKGLEGSQDYDLYLKVLEKTNKIHHITKVLYHWRKVPGSTAAVFSDKSYAQDAGKQALINAMKRRKIKADVVNAKHPGTYRVKYNIDDKPLISIVIPFKDMPELLNMCINSILKYSTYENFEIIGMSNNSVETETFKTMKRFTDLDKRIKFYKYNKPFNFSEINNYAVSEYAKGEHIILLNNDIEIISPDWIESMLELSQRKGTGAVGAKLYYPNDTIQHAGVVIGVLTLAGHSFKHHPREAPAYMGKESVIHNVSAVTAACLMIKKTIFDEVQGLNEEKLKIAFNDIDFCLRVTEAGYVNVITPYCEAYHHESVSRGYEDTPAKRARFKSEVNYMQNKHKKILKNGDPYYNINLTLEKEDYSLRRN